MRSYPPFEPTHLVARKAPASANRLGRLLYRTPFLKLGFDALTVLGLVLLAGAAGMSFGQLLCVLLIAPVATYMASGYDQRGGLTTRRHVFMSVAVTAFVAIVGLPLFGAGTITAGLLAGVAIALSRFALKASGLLDVPVMSLHVSGAEDLDPYLIKSLKLRLEGRAEIVGDPEQAELTLTLDGTHRPKHAPLAQAYPSLTGRAVFGTDGAGLDTQVDLNLRPQNTLYKIMKRVIDIGLAGSVALLLSPLLVIVWAAIKLESKGPSIFVQEREGHGGSIMKIRKFRSMKVDDSPGSDQRLWTSKNDDRITKVGKLIRKFRIDELPQLLSIILGEMSVVGPRPQRKFLNDMVPDTLSAEKDLRLAMVPGLTGWAQVNGGYFGNSHDFEEKQAFEIEKLRYDVYYAGHRSLILDVRIILLTVKTVLGRKGH